MGKMIVVLRVAVAVAVLCSVGAAYLMGVRHGKDQQLREIMASQKGPDGKPGLAYPKGPDGQPGVEIETLRKHYIDSRFCFNLIKTLAGQKMEVKSTFHYVYAGDAKPRLVPVLKLVFERELDLSLEVVEQLRQVEGVEDYMKWGNRELHIGISLSREPLWVLEHIEPILAKALTPPA